MPDDDRVSIGELSRRIDRGFADIKDDLREFTKRLEAKVDVKLHEELVRRVADLEAARLRDSERRVADKRAIFVSVIAPVIVAVVLAIAGLALAVYVALAKGTP